MFCFFNYLFFCFFNYFFNIFFYIFIYLFFCMSCMVCCALSCLFVWLHIQTCYTFLKMGDFFCWWIMRVCECPSFKHLYDVTLRRYKHTTTTEQLGGEWMVEKEKWRSHLTLSGTLQLSQVCERWWSHCIYRTSFYQC